MEGLVNWCVDQLIVPADCFGIRTEVFKLDLPSRLGVSNDVPFALPNKIHL